MTDKEKSHAQGHSGRILKQIGVKQAIKSLIAIVKAYYITGVSDLNNYFHFQRPTFWAFLFSNSDIWSRAGCRVNWENFYNPDFIWVIFFKVIIGQYRVHLFSNVKAIVESVIRLITSNQSIGVGQTGGHFSPNRSLIQRP